MTKFKKGDLVKIIGSTRISHNFSIGRTGVVDEVEETDGKCCYVSINGYSQWVSNRDLLFIKSASSKPSITIQIKKVIRKGKPFYTRTMIGANGEKLNDLYTRPSTCKKELDKIIEAIKNDDFEIKMVN